MPVNTRTEYAVRALLEIVKADGKPISVSDICKRQMLPRKYVEHLLASLKGSGVIRSIAGSKGGYVMALEPAAITLSLIVDAVEDKSWEFKCPSHSQEFCMGQGCNLHGLWDSVSQRMRGVLNDYSLQDIFVKNDKE